MPISQRRKLRLRKGKQSIQGCPTSKSWTQTPTDHIPGPAGPAWPPCTHVTCIQVSSGHFTAFDPLVALVTPRVKPQTLQHQPTLIPSCPSASAPPPPCPSPGCLRPSLLLFPPPRQLSLQTSPSLCPNVTPSMMPSLTTISRTAAQGILCPPSWL